MKLLNKNGAFGEYRLALEGPILTTIGGNLVTFWKFVNWRKAPAVTALLGFSMGNIVGCMHSIPDIATWSRKGERWNDQWIVNSHLDLARWNDVYKK
jgi:hypothetical protein